MSEDLVRCKVCNKPITREGTVGVGQGHRCTLVQKANGKTFYQTVTALPDGVVPVADVSRFLRKNKTKFPKATVSAFVKAFGTDGGIFEPVHPVFQVFLFNGQRYVSKWLLTEDALKAMNARNYEKVPAKAIVKIG